MISVEVIFSTTDFQLVNFILLVIFSIILVSDFQCKCSFILTILQGMKKVESFMLVGKWKILQVSDLYECSCYVGI